MTLLPAFLVESVAFRLFRLFRLFRAPAPVQLRAERRAASP